MSTISSPTASVAKPRRPADPDTKALALWVGWVAALSSISAGVYLSQKPESMPTIEVVAIPAQDGKPARFALIRSRPAPREERVAYELVEPADARSFYDVERPEGGDVIAKDASGFEVALARLPDPVILPPKQPHIDTRTVVLRLKQIEGARYVVRPDRAEARIDLKVTTEKRRPAPSLTVSTKSEKRIFAEGVDAIAVEYRLAGDQETLPYALDVPIAIGGGDLDWSDLKIDGADGRTLTIPAGESGRSIVVGLAEGVVARGRIERKFTVGFRPSAEILPGGATSVVLTIPASSVRLAWSLSETKIDRRRSDQQSRLQVVMSGPYPEPVTVVYKVAPESMRAFEPPLGAGGKRSVVLPVVGQASDPIFTFYADDVVGGPDRTVEIECEDVQPAGMADRRKGLKRLTITTSDNEPLEGRALVLAVLTEDLAGPGGEATRSQLAALARDQKEAMVDGRVYILDASDRKGQGGATIHGTIRRLDPAADPLVPEDAKPFKDDVLVDDVLEAAYLAVADQFGDRLRAREASFLVWCELKETPRAIKAQGRRTELYPPPVGGWHLLLVGKPGELAKRLTHRFPKVSNRSRFHALTREPPEILQQIQILAPSKR